MGKERIISIDLARGFGIILIVFGHVQDIFGADFGLFRSFLGLFQVPLFFFLSGLFFRTADTFGLFFTKKFKRLFIPFLLINIFFFIIEYIRALVLAQNYDGGLGFDDLLFTIGGLLPIPSYFVGQTWFLIVLFRVCVFYKLIDKIAKGNISVLSIIAVLLFALGMVTEYRFFISKTFLYFFFYHLGRLAYQYGGIRKYLFSRRTATIAILPAIVILVILSIIQPFDINKRFSVSVLIYLVGAILGICSTVWLSELCACIKWSTRVLSRIGNNTMTILLFHNFALGIFYKLIEMLNVSDKICSESPVHIFIALFTIMVLTELGELWSKTKSKRNEHLAFQ